MPISREELARRLRQARKACYLKQEDVARHLGVSRSTIAQIEAGRRSVSSLELDMLADIYGRDIREFLVEGYGENDALTVLFRKHPEVVGETPMATALRKAVALGRELTSLERLLGIERDAALPTYTFKPPRTWWQAFQQGERTAEEERRRLGLGNSPLQNVAELLELQGVRTAQLELPQDVSGMMLLNETIGIFIAVNNLAPGHSRLRRRFSYVHEYGHALLDRARRDIVSRETEGKSLPEVRADAFAAAFLMPAAGVREFVERHGKGRPSRLQAEIYDEAEPHRIRTRTEPGTQILQMHDVVLLAHHFGTSRLASLYRLRNLGLLTQPELENLLEQEQMGLGKTLQNLLGLSEPDPESTRNEFRHRFLALGLEAHRRGEITKGKLRELAALVYVDFEDLEKTLQRSGLDADDHGLDESQDA